MLKIGLGSPQHGSFTDPGTISGFASAVEAIGFDSLWVGDRALVPTQPRDPYSGGGPVPEEYRTFLDPIVTLSFRRTPPDGCVSGPARSTRPSTPRSCWPVR
ncbi:hypothetical protein [Streptomyces phaeochromogenes]